MSMSCLRIRSSSKSSGPSYTSVTETANGESLSSCLSLVDDGDSLTAGVAGVRSASSTGASGRGTLSSEVTTLLCMLLGIFRPRWLVRQRHSHCIAHTVHGPSGKLARPLAASLQNIPSQPRILLEFLAPVLHR